MSFLNGCQIMVVINYNAQAYTRPLQLTIVFPVVPQPAIFLFVPSA